MPFLVLLKNEFDEKFDCRTRNVIEIEQLD